MSDLKFFAQRIGLLGAVGTLVSLSGILLLPLLTKTMPLADYGVWAQVSVTTGLVPLAATLGLPYTMVRFLAAEQNRERIRDTFYSLLVVVIAVCVGVAVLLYLLAGPVAALLFGGNVAVTQIMAAVLCVEGVNIYCLNFFRAFQQMKKFSALTFARAYLLVAMIALFIFLGRGVAGAVAGMLITDVLLLLLMAALIVREIGVKVPGFRGVREHLAFGLPTVPGNLASWTVDASDRYVIAFYLGTASVGYYSPAYTLGSTINMFVSPISTLLTTLLARYHAAGDRAEAKRVLSFSLKCFLAVAIPAAIGLSLLSKPVLLVLATAAIADNGYLVTPIVALSAVVYGVMAILAETLMIQKKTHVSGSIWLGAAILNLGLNIAIVPSAGILGAALTTLASYTFGLAAVIWFSRKYVAVGLDLSFLLKCLVSALVMAAVLVVRPPVGVVGVLLTVAACAALYFVLLFLLGGIRKDEIAFVLGMAKTR